MTNLLLDHINTYIPLTHQAAEQIGQSFGIVEVPKRKIILKEGEVCRRLYFVAKGCLRMFYIDEKGAEQTIQFALENWWMTDMDAFHKKGIASYSIQAVENTSLLSINKDDLDLLLDQHPALEKYFRSIYERAYAASLNRMRFFRLPKEEIYTSFCLKYPDFIQRIPQKLLASFLGFTPEYLSELRKKKTPLK